MHTPGGSTAAAQRPPRAAAAAPRRPASAAATPGTRRLLTKGNPATMRGGKRRSAVPLKPQRAKSAQKLEPLSAIVQRGATAASLADLQLGPGTLGELGLVGARADHDDVRPRASMESTAAYVKYCIGWLSAAADGPAAALAVLHAWAAPEGLRNWVTFEHGLVGTLRDFGGGSERQDWRAEVAQSSLLPVELRLVEVLSRLPKWAPHLDAGCGDRCLADALVEAMGQAALASLPLPCGKGLGGVAAVCRIYAALCRRTIGGWAGAEMLLQFCRDLIARAGSTDQAGHPGHPELLAVRLRPRAAARPALTARTHARRLHAPCGPTPHGPGLRVARRFLPSWAPNGRRLGSAPPHCRLGSPCEQAKGWPLCTPGRATPCAGHRPGACRGTRCWMRHWHCRSVRAKIAVRGTKRRARCGSRRLATLHVTPRMRPLFAPPSASSALWATCTPQSRTVRAGPRVHSQLSSRTRRSGERGAPQSRPPLLTP